MTAYRKPRVVVIGAGVSGIVTAIEFKKKLGIDVVIYERMDRPGGTWAANTYPGCACDVPSHWYSLSTEQNSYWSYTYSSQPEIQAYWEGIFAKHNVDRQTHFGTVFLRADWDAHRNLYKIQFEQANDKSKTFTVEAEGVESFKGDRFHSARWRHDLDLSGKRVGVMATDVQHVSQFIPIISSNPSTKVLNFGRTPNWFAPRLNNKVTASQKKAFAYIPYLQTIYRAGMVSLLDARWIVWPLANKKIRGIFEAELTAYMRETAPKEYLEYLIPKYPVGCKRIIQDPGYLSALGQPNVDLFFSPIDTITEKGIRTKDGTEHELDVLILATGFDYRKRGLGIPVFNETGHSVTEQWKVQGGPQAYLGTTIAGFPNFYTMLGANVITGHTSAIASIECQVNYVVKMVGVMAKNGVESFQLSETAETDYNKWLQKNLNSTVWQGGCTSYYRLDNGKIVATWPGTFAYFWWLTRTPNFSHYIQKGGKVKVATIAKIKTLSRIVVLLAGLALLQYVGLSSLRDRIRSLV